MPEISRRSLAAGVGLLAGAVAVPAAAQQLLAVASCAQVPRPAAHLQSRQDQVAVGPVDHRTSCDLCRERQPAERHHRAARPDRSRQGPAGRDRRAQARAAGGLQFLAAARALFRVHRRRADQPVRRVRAGDQPGFRQPRSLEGGIRRHGQGDDRRQGPGDPGLHAARQAADQSPRRRSRRGPGRLRAADRHGHVRACL